MSPQRHHTYSLPSSSHPSPMYLILVLQHLVSPVKPIRVLPLAIGPGTWVQHLLRRRVVLWVLSYPVAFEIGFSRESLPVVARPDVAVKFRLWFGGRSGLQMVGVGLLGKYFAAIQGDCVSRGGSAGKGVGRTYRDVLSNRFSPSSPASNDSKPC